VNELGTLVGIWKENPSSLYDPLICQNSSCHLMHILMEGVFEEIFLLVPTVLLPIQQVHNDCVVEGHKGA